MTRFSFGVLVPASVFLAGTLANAGEIHWRSGRAVMQDKTADGLRAALTTLAADKKQSSHAVVRFDGPIGRTDTTKLRAAGIRLLSWLGDNAFFATIESDQLNIDRLIGNGRLIDAVKVRRDWKLHPILAADEIASWTVVSDKRTDNQTGDGGLKNATVAVLVKFFRDVPLQTVGTATIQRHGGVVRDQVRSVNTLVVEIPFTNIKRLANQDVVQYIEPPLPQFSEMNDGNRLLTGVEELHGPSFGLDGSGVTVMILDGGRPLESHVDFGGRLTARDTLGFFSSHATHVSGTVGGDGTASGGQWRGMAPGVTLETYTFESNGDDIFLYSNPGDMEANYDEAINVFGAVVSNNSIGTNVRANGFPCSITGDYGITSELIDSMVTGSLGPSMRIVWSNGNERGQAGCSSTSPGGYHSIPPPASAKNHIAVGAVDSDTDLPTDFTSWGPADDGRLRPDVSAPGCQIGGDEGVTSCDRDGGYDAKCGTSMAAPTVTGIVALMLEDHRERFPGESDPANATIKAILAHTAQDIMTDGPDYQSGYGSVRAVPAIEQMRSGNFLEESIDHGGVFNATIVVPDGTESVRITLAWDDVPGTPNVDPALVNDLDLAVFDPDGVRHFPWTLDPDAPDQAAVQTKTDRVNNLEQVFAAFPVRGAWRVEVRGFSIPFGPQSFSLVGSPILVNCSRNGTASLNSSAYQCNATITLRVADCDLNTDDSAIETVMAHVASDSNPDGFDVLLTETIAASAAFEAQVVLGTSPPGELSVQHGDSLTLTYVDADNGKGVGVTVTDTSVVDCVGPVISAVGVPEANPRDATITFVTDELANATVRYGLSCDALTGSHTVGGFRTEHSLRIINLERNTSYSYAIDATDVPGNSSSAGNAGSCFTFATPDVPEHFTERFDESDNDLGFDLVIFEPNGLFEFYSACSTPIQTFPVEPSAGIELELGDDEFAPIALADGATVSLYGVSYDTIFVGSNGYVTFGEGDSDHTESEADHFSLPRISGVFDDLSPNEGGSISWLQLSDRVVVTFDEVLEFGFIETDTVSFQIEMFFDGTIRIAYLDIQLDDGIAGLSAGNGLDPDFFPSDLTGFDECGPQPPVAYPANVATPFNEAIDIELSGGDVGSRAGELTYAIVSLPNQAILDVATHHVIRESELPYALTSGAPTGGPEVQYIPVGGFSGSDAFGFVVNDGDKPPAGGDSNHATVAIQVGGPRIVHSFDLSEDPGWTGTGEWEFGVPFGLGSHSGDPSGGFTGENVYGYNLSGDYPNSMASTQYLTTEAINLTNVSGVQLSYRRWLGVERAQWDHASIDFSTDGSKWTTVWENSVPTTIDDDAWIEHVVDLSDMADDQVAIFLRWGMGTTDSSITYPGWNIDDITLIGERPLLPPDLNNDGNVNITDFEQFTECRTGPVSDALANGCSLVDYDNDGDVDQRDFGMFQLLFSLR